MSDAVAERKRFEVEDFAPRKVFLPFHERSKRWTCIVAHRRCGKTLATVADLITRAIATRKKHAQYAYIAPFYAQAKAVAWNYLKRYAEPVLSGAPKETELSVTLHNGSTIRLFGADNDTALRGMYLDGVVMDEAGDMKPSVWQEVVRPMLSDRNGWAVFIGTPRGRNYFQDIHELSLRDPDWLGLTLKASETHILPQSELDDARKMMADSAYRQEYECDFYAPVLGAIYADELNAARDEGRITNVPHDPILQVHTAWDLGIDDATAILFFQQHNSQIRIIDYLEHSGEGLPFYASVLKQKPYIYGNHYAPHDIEVRELGSGLSRLEVARTLGINFTVVPNIPVEEGIHAGRLALSRAWIDSESCGEFVDALNSYRREYDDKLRVFKPKPVHNWASHAADCWRYLSVVSRTNRERSPYSRAERRGSWQVR